MLNVILWLALALMWSSSFTAIKLGVDTIAPMPLVFGRMLIGLAIMFAVLKIRKMTLSRNRRDWFVYAFSGLMGNTVPFVLIGYGEQHVDSALAALLMGIAPVATVLIAHIAVPGEGLTRRSAAGIATGFLGLAMLVGPGALSGLGSHLVGQIAIVCAALCYAVTTIVVKNYAIRPPLEMATGSMLVGTLFIGAATIASLVLSGPGGLAVPSVSSVAAVVYLGVFSTAMATLIYFYLVPRIGASRMSQINFAVPIGGALLGVAFLGETVAPSKALALCVIVTAIYLVTSRPGGSRARTG
jgi:drug/metabolite transporter (DMT)-like permease